MRVCTQNIKRTHSEQRKLWQGYQFKETNKFLSAYGDQGNAVCVSRRAGKMEQPSSLGFN